jgi:hypothetical protein
MTGITMKSNCYLVGTGHFLRKYRFYILIFIFSVLPTLFLSGTTIADPRPILEINPMGYVNELFNVWSPHQLGYAHGHDISYLPLALIFSALTNLFSAMIVQRLLFLSIFFVAGTSFFLLARQFSLGNRFALVGALFYMYNFYPLVWFGDGSSTMLLPYAFCPLFLFLTIKALKEKKLVYVIFIAGITGLFGGINPPETIIAFIPTIVYLIISLERGNYFPIKYSAALLFAFSLANLYWILPGVSAVLSSGPGALNLYVEPPSFENRYSSFAQVFRGLGQWGFFDGWQGSWYYPYAPFYMFNALGIALSYVIPTLAVVGLILRRPFDKKYFLLVILLIASIPLAIGGYPVNNPGPNGQLFIWMYNNVPLFNAFRATYKFVMLVSLAYAILFPTFLMELAHRLPPVIKKLRPRRKMGRQLTPMIVVTLGLTLVLVTYWPAWTGGIENPNRSFQVPSYYGDAASYFKNDPGKVIMLTPHRFGSNYEWGILAGGNEVFEAILQSPVIDENPSSAFLVTPGNLLINSMYSGIYANQTVSIPVLMDYLGVEYLVQQNDVNISMDSSLSPSMMKGILMTTPGLTFIGSFGKLDLYHHETTHGYVSAYSSTRIVDVDNDHSMVSQIVNTSIVQSLIASSDWRFCSIRTSENIRGNFAIDTISSISWGENMGLLVYFADQDFAVFTASSASGAGSGMYYYKDGTLTQQSLNQSIVVQPAVPHTLQVAKNNGSFEFSIDGVAVGNYSLGKSQDDNYQVGVGTSRAIATFDQFKVSSADVDRTYRFNYSVLSLQKDFEMLGGVWSIAPSNQPSATNSSILLVTSDQAQIIKELPQSMVLPESISYAYDSPVDIKVSVTDSRGPFVLVLKTTFDKFKCTVNGQEISEQDHFTANSYQNAWLINKTGNLSITLSYDNQNDHVAMIISGVVITIFLAFMMTALSVVVVGRKWWLRSK